MTEYKRIELVVGMFVFIGIASMVWMALKLGQVGGLGSTGYAVEAVFQDAGGVRAGSDVMLAGVVIGRVSDVHLQNDEEAKLIMQIDEGVKLTTDAIASVRTKGIIGERYIRVSQGADREYLEPGAEIEETESAINIEDLVSKYIFSSGDK
ncbi:MAG: outer membrane lipid asymmetry maintenance protein MlaD [Zetaproteobacteria bacterium]|nr:outer membrane lipid asymmetry maintenance protein MlaD [Zetaproteobacteria bacterium]